jgi:hypothetical protein
VYANIQAALGEKWQLWLVPTYETIPGHGTAFPIRRYRRDDESTAIDVHDDVEDHQH